MTLREALDLAVEALNIRALENSASAPYGAGETPESLAEAARLIAENVDSLSAARHATDGPAQEG